MAETDTKKRKYGNARITCIAHLAEIRRLEDAGWTLVAILDHLRVQYQLMDIEYEAFRKQFRRLSKSQPARSTHGREHTVGAAPPGVSNLRSGATPPISGVQEKKQNEIRAEPTQERKGPIRTNTRPAGYVFDSGTSDKN